MNKAGTWKDRELKLLEMLYPYHRNCDIAEVMGRSKSGIDHKASRMNLEKDENVMYKIRSKAHRGANSGNFKGYRRITTMGYVALYKPEHPNSSKDGLILEHRYVMSKHLGRPLEENERVHHINGNKQDNRIKNLQLIMHGEHTRLHHTGMKRSYKTRQLLSQRAKERLTKKEVINE